MFSLFVKERLFIGEAVIATRSCSLLVSFLSTLELSRLMTSPFCLAVVGIIAGPYVTNGFNPRGWGGGSHEVVNEITLVRLEPTFSAFPTLLPAQTTGPNSG